MMMIGLLSVNVEMAAGEPLPVPPEQENINKQPLMKPQNALMNPLELIEQNRRNQQGQIGLEKEFLHVAIKKINEILDNSRRSHGKGTNRPLLANKDLQAGIKDQKGLKRPRIPKENGQSRNKTTKESKGGSLDAGEEKDIEGDRGIKNKDKSIQVNPFLQKTTQDNKGIKTYMDKPLLEESRRDESARQFIANPMQAIRNQETKNNVLNKADLSPNMNHNTDKERIVLKKPQISNEKSSKLDGITKNMKVGSFESKEKKIKDNAGIKIKENYVAKNTQINPFLRTTKINDDTVIESNNINDKTRKESRIGGLQLVANHPLPIIQNQEIRGKLEVTDINLSPAMEREWLIMQGRMIQLRLENGARNAYVKDEPFNSKRIITDEAGQLLGKINPAHLSVTSPEFQKSQNVKKNSTPFEGVLESPEKKNVINQKPAAMSSADKSKRITGKPRKNINPINQLVMRSRYYKFYHAHKPRPINWFNNCRKSAH